MIAKWNYAELSISAKAVGGPEKFVELLQLSGRKKGRIDMIPCVIAAALISPKFMDLFKRALENKKRKKISNQEAIETAKREIVTGIEEYDAEHDEIEDNANNIAILN